MPEDPGYRRVRFPSEGAELVGRLYLPTAPRAPVPVVVMAHGTSATVPMVMDRYAEAFRDAGIGAFAFDHRNFGESGGEPRFQINPWIQARGIRDALACVAGMAGVDPDRLGLWGDSAAGGEVLVVAAFDRRVKAVVAQCPVCGSRPPPADATHHLGREVGRLLADGDVSAPPESTLGPMPVVSWDQTRHPSLLKPLQAYRWFMEYGGRHGSTWSNDVTRVSPPTPAPFHPGLVAPFVAAPTLMMVAPEDEMVHANPTVSRSVYESLACPKEWYEIAGGHFGLLWHPSALFDEAVGVQVAFLQRRLNGAPEAKSGSPTA